MDILSRTPPKADHRLAYATTPQQFGDLWIPSGAAKKWPVVVFLHGGWWLSEFGLDYAGFLCEAMKAAGVAVWSLEYRRVGDAGGGWPGTFQDAAAGFDQLAKLAEIYPLDLGRVIAAGHSAGGHLAFWLAGRHHVPPGPLAIEPRVSLKGIVGVAAAVDLRLTIELSGYFSFSEGGPAVKRLMGGGSKDVPDRYKAGNPGELLPLGVPQVLVQGMEDVQIPGKLPGLWADAARRQGDHVEVKMVPEAGHFELMDPEEKAFGFVRDAMLELLRG